MSDIALKLTKIGHALANDFTEKPSPQALGILLVNNLDFFTELSPAIVYLNEAGLNDQTLYHLSRSAVINAFYRAAEFAANPL